MENKERIEELKQRLTEIAEKEGIEVVFVENEKPAKAVLPPSIKDLPIYHNAPTIYDNPYTLFPNGQEKRRERRAKERELKRKKK